MNKILIVYATAGEGHKRAAVALKSQFDILSPENSEVRIVDALDYTNGFFKWFYPRMYIFMVTYVPTIWGFFYYLSDLRWLYPLVRRARRAANRANTAPFEEFLRGFDPDIIVTTHFLASEVISDLKRRGSLKAKLVTCVTDFRMHAFWFSEETDFFCVSFKETEDDLTKKWGISAKKINITGIPIHPKFYGQKDKSQIRKKLNLSIDALTILITGGGFGVGPITAIVRALLKMDEALQILVVCGHNEKLLRNINNFAARSPETRALQARAARPKPLTTVKAYGFIDYVDELMSVSDIGITKAGGLICSEAIAKELPLIIIAPIPGQESRNCKLLEANNAAFELKTPSQIKRAVTKIYYNNMLTAMKENIRRIRRENPAMNIAKFALTLIPGGR